MLRHQRTLKKPVEYTGFGLHTGEEVTVRFLPAEPNVGLRFRVRQGEGRVAEGRGTTPPPIPKPAAVAAPAPGEIEKLNDGKTIAEITTNSASLQEQSVRLRARVIKVSANIMGKNWVTLQDGTGSAPNDKLLATSSQMVAPGDLVTVQGVVRNDVDLGSGYRYNVLLEEATFTK